MAILFRQVREDYDGLSVLKKRIEGTYKSSKVGHYEFTSFKELTLGNIMNIFINVNMAAWKSSGNG